MARAADCGWKRSCVAQPDSHITLGAGSWQWPESRPGAGIAQSALLDPRAAPSLRCHQLILKERTRAGSVGRLTLIELAAAARLAGRVLWKLHLVRLHGVGLVAQRLCL